jgi:hypothetical protein
MTISHINPIHSFYCFIEKGVQMERPEMFQALHPDPSKQGTRVTKSTYDAYKEALLKVIPDSEDGIEFTALSDAVVPHLSKDVLNNSSPGWWTTTVKLDLEARGLIKRIGSPGRQRLRRF